VVGRIIKVDHVGDYKRKLEEDEEEKQKKREERGVCTPFSVGNVNVETPVNFLMMSRFGSI